MNTIGKAEHIDIIGHAKNVPAKIDTGADSSSIWASDVRIDKDNRLHFTLFGPGSEYYTGEEIVHDSYKVAKVKSSSGHVQVRYRTVLTMLVKGRRIRALFNLSDRSSNNFPILIGRRTISGKFLVDVREGVEIPRQFKQETLNKELQEDPRQFFEKYHGE